MFAGLNHEGITKFFPSPSLYPHTRSQKLFPNIQLVYSNYKTHHQLCPVMTKSNSSPKTLKLKKKPSAMAGLYISV